MIKYQKQKLEKNIPFDIAPRKIKYLGSNLNNDINYLYSVIYTTLKKEIKEDTQKMEACTVFMLHGQVDQLKLIAVKLRH